MDSLLVSAKPYYLPISLRTMHLILGSVIFYGLAIEQAFSGYWETVLSVLAGYAFITGIFGKDPLFAILKLSVRPLPDYALGVVAQLECLFIGLVCIAAGVMNLNVNSIVVIILPFLGIYPVLLCAVKHDLLGYLILSYRRDN